MGIEWSLPMGIAAVSLLAGIALIVTIWFRQFSGWIMHLFALGITCIILLGPQSRVVSFSNQAQFNVHGLVDISQSMSQTDDSARSRLAYLQQHVFTVKKSNQDWQQFHWQWSTFGQALNAATLETLSLSQASENQTQLLNALSQLNRRLPTGEPIVIFSDGNSTETPQNLAIVQALKNSKRPIHALALGKPRKDQSLRTYAWAQPSVIALGQETVLHVQLQGMGALDESEQLHIALYQSDQLLAKTSQSVSVLDTMQWTFPLKKLSAGLHVFEVRIADMENIVISKSTASVNVIDQPLNVLLIESQPHWLTRNVARALQMDPQTKLTARYGLGDDRQLQINQSSQQQVVADIDLEQLDVVLLGKSTCQQLPQSFRQSLGDWVDAGGGLLWLRGLPTNQTAWPASLLPEKRMSKGAVERLSRHLDLPKAFLENFQIRSKTLGTVGHVRQINLDDLNLTATRNLAVDQFVIRLVQNLAKPLSVEKNAWARMTLDRHAMEIGQKVSIQLWVNDNRQPILQITNPHGQKTLLQLSTDTTSPLHHAAHWIAQNQGVYQFELISHDLPPQALHVRPADQESEHLSANHGLLQHITQQTGGHLWLSHEQMLDDLKQDQQRRLAGQSNRAWEDRFNHPALVVLVLICLLTGWYLNRRKGGV